MAVDITLNLDDEAEGAAKWACDKFNAEQRAQNTKIEDDGQEVVEWTDITLAEYVKLRANDVVLSWKRQRFDEQKAQEIAVERAALGI